MRNFNGQSFFSPCKKLQYFLRANILASFLIDFDGLNLFPKQYT